MPAPASAKTDAQLIEIFSSIQGEGLLVGARQIFVRMALCNLDCGYCDTPFEPRPDCRAEDAPGSGNFRSLPNPVSLDLLASMIHQWNSQLPGAHHSLSLTGGEPLVQGEVLTEWLPVLRKMLPVYLETNGTLPRKLEPLVPHLDHVSMDVKLPSMTGCDTPWEAHREFLALARRTWCQVKVVLGEETPRAEVEEAARLVREVAPEVPLVLQPVTRGGEGPISPRYLLDLQTRISAIHPFIRIIPQTHRFTGFL